MKKLLLPLLLLIIPQILFSQISKKEQSEELRRIAKEIRMQEQIGTPAFMSFSSDNNLTHEQAIEYSKGFCAAVNSGFTLKNQHTSKDGKQLYRYEQTIAGYPIEFSAWHVHERDGKVVALNGDIVDIDNFNVVFSISEEEALQVALNYIGAELYMWMNEGEEQNLKIMLEDDAATYYPTGIKVITPVQPDIRKHKLTTAYKFNIYSLKPFDRKMVYVDAQTGEILFDLPLIHFNDRVEGIAHTAYYGIQPIQTTQQGAQYILHDLTRGNGIKTYNCQNTINYNGAVNFFDDDNVWNNVNAQLDQYATDAHFSTGSTYDYYLNVHNRNSINGNGYNLLSYVHFNLIQYGYSNNINAFWDGQRMTYGDGAIGQGITPLTTIDICGHEITHGLTSFTANLVYSYESGALSEAFSDIFGTAVEFYAVPEHANWTMGEKMGLTLRSLSNPKAHQLPNTYHGQYWYTGSGDNGGVHYNCGPLSYWFYLLCMGGIGTNDNGNAYQVAAIGIENAEQIAFKTLTEYLSPSSQYIDVYNYAIIATGELFGGCSPEVQAVGDAFYAIGVINTPFVSVTSANFKASETIFCSVPAQVTFTNKSMNGITYLWNFGDGTTSTESNPVHTYTQAGNYTVTLSVDGGVCGSDMITKEQYIKIDPSSLCAFNMLTSGQLNKEGCTGVFYSPGWPNNYPNNADSRLTIYAPGATGIVLTIEEFDIEPGAYSTCNYDYICFHNGNSISAPKINNTNYCNTTGNPGTITATGEYITIRFVSDVYMQFSGFKITFQCTGLPSTPNANFSANTTTSCTGNIKFTDNSTNQPDEWLWEFGDEYTSVEQHPEHQYVQTGTYTVTLTVTNEFGSNTIQKVNYITVEIPEPPEIDVIEGCNNEEFEIILDLEGIAHWYENITDEEPVYIGNYWLHPPVEENITYFLCQVIQAPEGSVDEFCTSSFTEVLIISEECVLPKAKFEVNTEITCNGNIQFIDHSTHEPNMWLWDFGDGSTGAEQNPLHQYMQNGIYTVSLTVTNEFGTDNIQNENLITVEMPEPPEIDPIFVCTGEEFEIALDLEGLAYWYESITDQEPVYVGNIWTHPQIDAPATYYYYLREVTDAPQGSVEDYCASSFTEVQLLAAICEPVHENNLDHVKILPNPSNGIFYVKGLMEMADYKYIVTDIAGQVIIENKLLDSKLVDLSQYSNGIYFIKLSTSDILKTFKVVNMK